MNSTEIKGAVDTISIKDKSTSIGGWAYQQSGGVRKPIDYIELDHLMRGEIELHARPDFDTDEAFGFTIHLHDDKSLIAAALGLSRIFACAGGARIALEIWTGINAKIAEVVVETCAKNLTSDAIGKLVEHICQLARQTSPGETATSSEAVDVIAEAGLISLDSTAVVGKGGYLFLYGGSNEVSRLYGKPPNENLVDAWVRVVRSRIEYCTQNEATFRQLIFPEKQSVLSDLYPFPIEAPTKLYDRLRVALGTNESFLDGFSIFRSLYCESGLSPFRKIDSHLSFHGCEAAVRHLLSSLGLSAVIPEPTFKRVQRKGDLGGKFGRGNFLELTLMPDDGWQFHRQAPALIDSVDPPEGHSGIVRKWTNDSAPIDRSVLIFGNSFFERGGDSTTLSYWLARLFTKVSFFWTSQLMRDVVSRERPSIVICQTIERFLEGVPGS